MAKSIRSKAKRKLRAVKREKLAAKERIRLLAIQEQEEGVKMIQDATESSELGENISAIAGDGNKAMEVVPETQSVLKAKKKKKSKTGSGKNVKRLNKKKKNKYKW